MSENELHDLLRKVHEQLKHATSVDAQSRQLLMKVTDDIERTVGAEAVRGELARQSLPRLEALAVRFESEHPALGQGLRRLVEWLANAGI